MILIITHYSVVRTFLVTNTILTKKRSYDNAYQIMQVFYRWVFVVVPAHEPLFAPSALSKVEGHIWRGLGSAVNSPSGLRPGRQMVLPYFKHSGCTPDTSMVFCYWRQKVTAMLLTVAEITAYLGPVPLSHSVQHGASQRSIPDWKHCNRLQHKLHKG